MFTGFLHLYLFTMWELFGRLYNRWGHLCVEREPSDLCYVHTTWSGIQHMWTSLEPKWQWWDCLLWCDGSAGHHWRLHTGCFWRQWYICKSVLAKFLVHSFFILCHNLHHLHCKIWDSQAIVGEHWNLLYYFAMSTGKQSLMLGAGQAIFLMLEPEDGDDMQPWNISDYQLTWCNIHKVQNLSCLSHVILIPQMHHNSSNQPLN